jgi:hypothetical protein
MQALREVLQQYSGNQLTLGSRNTTSEKFDRVGLQRALKDLSQRNERYFMAGIIMAIVLFASLLVIGFFQLTGKTPDKIVPPVFGSSAAVIVWRTFRTWREKSYTDCVLALVPNVDDATLKTIVAVLVTKL